MPFFQETLHFLFIILKRDIGDFYLIPFTARQKYNNSLYFDFFSENIFQFGISYLDLGYVHTMHVLESFLYQHKKLSSIVWAPIRYVTLQRDRCSAAVHSVTEIMPLLTLSLPNLAKANFDQISKFSFGKFWKNNAIFAWINWYGEQTKRRLKQKQRKSKLLAYIITW